MSVFRGRMKEYPCVSIDRFDGDNLKSTCYFLSHTHADHMQGLDLAEFQYRLSSSTEYKLYCSRITKALLLVEDKYKPLANSVIELDVNVPHDIAVPDPDTRKVTRSVVVTLLNAEHCPGSVMFLFEGSEGTVLYTGDFRLNKHDISGMQQLHSGSRPKDIKSLYIDTTFCVPQAMYIPSREESNKAVISIIRDWLDKGNGHMVHISHNATIGYENLYRSLCVHFQMKVHVDATRHDCYKNIGDMSYYTTADPTETQIHVCRGNGKNRCSALHPSNECLRPMVCNIHLSTMYFVNRVQTDMYAKRFSETRYRVCYSFHSSYGEIRDIVSYLKPNRAYANVIPVEETMDQIENRLSQMVRTAKTCSLHDSPNGIKPLGSLDVRKRKYSPVKSSQESSASSAYLFDDLGVSPIKVKHHKIQESKFPLLHDISMISEDNSDNCKPSRGTEHNLTPINSCMCAEEDFTTPEDHQILESSNANDTFDVSPSQNGRNSEEQSTPLKQKAVDSHLAPVTDNDEINESTERKTEPLKTSSAKSSDAQSSKAVQETNTEKQITNTDSSCNPTEDKKIPCKPKVMGSITDTIDLTGVEDGSSSEVTEVYEVKRNNVKQCVLHPSSFHSTCSMCNASNSWGREGVGRKIEYSVNDHDPSARSYGINHKEESELTHKEQHLIQQNSTELCDLLQIENSKMETSQLRTRRWVEKHMLFVQKGLQGTIESSPCDIVIIISDSEDESDQVS